MLNDTIDALGIRPGALTGVRYRDLIATFNASATQ
jgi:hypothetical protein